MPRKGQKSKRGQPDTDWGELKDVQIKTKLTSTGRTLVASYLRSHPPLTLTEILERLARGLLKLEENQPSQLAIAIQKEIFSLHCTVEEFADRAGIPLNRIDTLLDSQPATPGELVWLQSVLHREDGNLYDIEELKGWNDYAAIQNSGGSGRSDRTSRSGKDAGGTKSDRPRQ